MNEQKSAWAAFPSFRKIRETLEAESPGPAQKPNFFKCLVVYSLVAGAYALHVLSAVDRGGRKIARQLASFHEGAYLHLVFKDKSDCYGHLGPLSATSFAFKEVTTGSISQISFNDIESVTGAVASSTRTAFLLPWVLLMTATALSTRT